MFKRSLSWAAIALACLVAGSAIAETNTVSAQPYVDFISQVLNPALGVLALAVLALIRSEVKRFTGFSWSDSLQAQAAAWATTEAGAFAASLEGNLGARSFTVGSPEVAAIVNAAPTEILAVLGELGWSTDKLSKLVVAAIGRLQQSAAVLPAPAAAKA